MFWKQNFNSEFNATPQKRNKRKEIFVKCFGNKIFNGEFNVTPQKRNKSEYLLQLELLQSSDIHVAN